jgi:hypothetical protein
MSAATGSEERLILWDRTQNGGRLTLALEQNNLDRGLNSETRKTADLVTRQERSGMNAGPFATITSNRTRW